MGIPKFYRWLSERYPLINQKIEDDVRPQFDCLYLDMNGIFHNCSHGGASRCDLSVEEMFVEIMKYIAYIVQLVRPRQLLYLAVDGVAPRAKQNQQRQRRFVAARDRRLDIARKKREGRRLGNLFDSNCITPGTDFMDRLSIELDLFIKREMSENGLWKKLTVIYSDHLTPGEGEHKIMTYVRGAKMQSSYNPDTRHCIYGLDADLIMLSLVSHEINFALLREEVIFGLQQQQRKFREDSKALRSGEEFQLLHISLLRQMLEVEFKPMADTLPFDYDIERIIDDFVFICILVGNDFVPHLPTIDIATGGLSTLFDSYQELLPTLSGYLTDAGSLNMENAEKFLRKLAQNEREQLVQQFEHLKSHWSKSWARSGGEFTREPSKAYLSRQLQMLEIKDPGKYSAEHYTGDGTEVGFDSLDKVRSDGIWKKKKMKKKKTTTAEMKSAATLSSESAAFSGDIDIVAADAFLDDGALMDAQIDVLSNGVDAEFRSEYYESRWCHSARDNELMALKEAGIRQIAVDYVKTLSWVLRYYYNGCASWGWYYPHHYAPLVSDLTGLSAMDVTLLLGQPYLPFQQLLAVLPISSNDFLPVTYRLLMTSKDSPISNMYPTDFEIDMNLATVPWQGIALLPFIDDGKLKMASAMVNERTQLTELERRRNIRGCAFEYKFDPMKALGSDLASAKSSPLVTRSRHFEPRIPPRAGGGDGLFVPLPCRDSRKNVEGFPQLHVVKFEASLKKIGCTLFGRKSKYPTMVLKINNALAHPISGSILRHAKAKRAIEEAEAKRGGGGKGYKSRKKRGGRSGVRGGGGRGGDFAEGFGELAIDSSEAGMLDLYKMPEMKSETDKRWQQDLENAAYNVALRRFVFVAWPYVREAKMDCVETAWNQYVVNEDGRVTSQRKSDADHFEFHKKCVTIRDSLLETFGVDTGVVNVLVHAHKLVGMRRRVDRGGDSAAASGLLQPRTLKLFSREVETFALQLCIDAREGSVLRDFRFEERFVDIPQEFELGAPVMYIGNELKYFGKYGRVIKPPTVEPDCGHVLDIRVINRFDATDFPQRIVERYHKQVQYYGLHEAADMCGMNAGVFARLCGSLLVKNGRNESLEIGLNLKLSRRGKVMAGFARGVPMRGRGFHHSSDDVAGDRKMIHKFEFTDKAIQLVTDYRRSFPRVIELLNSQKGFKFSLGDFAPVDLHEKVMAEYEEMEMKRETAEEVTAKAAAAEKTESATTTIATMSAKDKEILRQANSVVDFFAKKGDAFDRLLRSKRNEYGLQFAVRCHNWLADLPISKQPFVDCSSQVLDVEAIAEIERSGDEYYMVQKSQKPMGLKMQKVPLAHVYSADPCVHWSPTYLGNFKLGDRVSSLRSDGGCPFGTLGTVVGTHSAFVEVVCDKPVVGGSDLHSRCSPHRGLLMKHSTLVNLTRPPRFRSHESHRGKHRRPQPRRGGPGGGYHPRHHAAGRGRDSRDRPPAGFMFGPPPRGSGRGGRGQHMRRPERGGQRHGGGRREMVYMPKGRP